VHTGHTNSRQFWPNPEGTPQFSLSGPAVRSRFESRRRRVDRAALLTQTLFLGQKQSKPTLPPIWRQLYAPRR
jgi:hypothetical protein